MTIWQTLRNWWLAGDVDDAPAPKPQPPGDGWMLWLPQHHWRQSPYMHDQVFIWRSGWEHPRAVKPYELLDRLNVSGLYWKPAP